MSKDTRDQKKTKYSAKKERALTLFLETSLTQSEIAETVGVTENTIVNWKKKGEWESLRGAKEVSNEKILHNLYGHAHRLSAQEELDVDKLAKLTASIERLEMFSKKSFKSYLDAFSAFNTWLANEGYKELFKQISPLQKEFLQTQNDKLA